MANVKITELTAATALAGTDVLPIVDVGADATKKVSVSDLLRNLPDGTASAPALAFADDQNSGLLSPAENELAFATSGTQRLVITSSGYVGLGTSSPSAPLDVETSNDVVIEAKSTDRYAHIDLIDNASSSRFTTDGDTGTLRLRADTGNAVSNSRIQFEVDGSEKLRIDSSGNVGIGTTSPTGLLHVEGSTFSRFLNTTAPTLDNNTHAGEALFLRSGGSSGNGNVQAVLALGKADSSSLRTGAAIGSIQTDSDADRIGLSFYTSPSSSSSQTLSEKLRITHDGKVGIGTTSPSQKLQVTDGTYSNFYVAPGYNNGTGTMLSVGGGEYMSFATGVFGTERMRIDSSGRLLVGTTSDTQSTTVLLKGNSSGVANAGTLRIERGQGAGSITSSGIELGTIALGASAIPSAIVKAESDGNWTAGSSYPTRLTFSTTADGASSPTERMRIDNAGKHSIYGDTNVLRLASNQGPTTAFTLIQARRSETSTTSTTGTDSFRVFCNGNVENSNNSYGGISDAKLKENIVDASSQWDDIKGIRVRNYNFIEGQTHTQLGVVAQEVETVSPGLVTESPDRDDEGNDLGTVTKSVNYSVLYMKAVKALQEAMDRIETLEAKVAALEAQ